MKEEQRSNLSKAVDLSLRTTGLLTTLMPNAGPVHTIVLLQLIQDAAHLASAIEQFSGAVNAETLAEAKSSFSTATRIEAGVPK